MNSISNSSKYILGLGSLRFFKLLSGLWKSTFLNLQKKSDQLLIYVVFSELINDYLWKVSYTEQFLFYMSIYTWNPLHIIRILFYFGQCSCCKVLCVMHVSCGQGFVVIWEQGLARWVDLEKSSYAKPSFRRNEESKH